MSKPRTIAEYPNRADDYDEAVSKSHVQNTDTVLDEGGDHEVTAEDIRGHVDSTENPHQVTAGQVGAYTKGETDDLLDDKADQSALNATNQAVSTLDGRVDMAEGDIQNLQSEKPDYEQGTWTPALRGSTLAGEYIIDIGEATYSVIGDDVFAQCRFTVEQIITPGTGVAIIIAGLPYPRSSGIYGSVRLDNALYGGGSLFASQVGGYDDATAISASQPDVAANLIAPGSIDVGTQIRIAVQYKK